MSQQCHDCKSFSIKEDFNDGSYVCTTCGLVADTLLLDERPIMHNDHLEDFREESEHMFISICQSIFLPEYIAELSIEIFLKNKGSIRGSTMCLKAVSLYLACEQYGIQDFTYVFITRLFNVTTTSFLSLLKFIKPNIKKIQTPMINKYKNIINIMFKDCSREQKVTIAKKSDALYMQLKNHPKFVNKKPSKLDVIIVYFIGTQIEQVRVFNPSIISLKFDVSTTTLKKTCQLIKTAKVLFV